MATGRRAWLAVLVLAAAPSTSTEPETPPGASVPRRPSPAWAPEVAASTEVPSEPGWYTDRVTVRVPADQTADELAVAVGGTVLADVGRSGLAVLGVDDVGAASAALAARGITARPAARVVGVGKKKKAAAAAPPPRPDWHQTALGLGSVGDYSDLVVAVLDSGVAYETAGRFVQVPGLSGTRFVDPVDLVEFDGHPNDDHQHGTHITSLIASTGVWPGVAPGVGVMPIKVLGSDNCGTDQALIEGLWWAVDHHADVVNLSLALPAGYLPGAELEDVLEAAVDAGIVVVGAAGNDGAREVAWPAAARGVIAVGAARSDAATSWIDQTPYSNFGSALRVLAPGGSFELDVNADGWPDGILAETIDRADPSRVGGWFYQGTSQATALVSGVAVRLLAAGVPPEDVGARLQRGQWSPLNVLLTGVGAPLVSESGAAASSATGSDVFVGMAPYLGRSLFGGKSPRARVTVVTDEGVPLRSVVVAGRMASGSDVELPTCTTDEHGTCTLYGSPFMDGERGAWSLQVDGVVVGGTSVAPGKAWFASDASTVVIGAAAALEQAGEFDSLGLYWPGGDDPGVGSTFEAWAVVDNTPSRATVPFAVLLDAAELPTDSFVEEVLLDVDGVGLMSSPMGGLSVRKLTFGTGLMSSPMGGLSLRAGSLRVLGLSVDAALGFSAAAMYASPEPGAGTSTLGLGWHDDAVFLDSGATTGCGAGEEHYTDLGELRTADGFEPARWVIAAGLVDVGLAFGECTPLAASVDGIEFVR